MNTDEAVGILRQAVRLVYWEDFNAPDGLADEAFEAITVLEKISIMLDKTLRENK